MRLSAKNGRPRGISLLETLVYMACMAILLSVLSVGTFRLIHAYEGLNRRTDAVARALQAGEAWRAQVRQLTTMADVGQAYRFNEGRVMRLNNGQEETVLRGIKSSRMHRGERQGVIFWQWDVELGGGEKFTFLAVPGGKGMP